MAALDRNSKYCMLKSLSKKKSDFKLDPFWATRLWQHIVKHAFNTVKIGRRWHYFKCHDQVFDGEDLVSAVYQCLQNCLADKIPREVSRENAVKVCQVLLNNNFFECVSPKCHTKFEDSSTKLYRFLADQMSEQNIFLEDDKENDRTLRSLSSLKSSVTELVKVCDIKAVNEVQGSSERILKTVNRNFSFKSSLQPRFKADWRRSSAPIMKKRHKTTATPKTVCHVKQNGEKTLPPVRTSGDELTEETYLAWRGVAFSHLLTLVNVPILESMLSMPPMVPPLCPESHLIIQNTPQHETGTFRLSSTCHSNVTNVPWVEAAKQCLGNMPQGIEQLWSLQACKILCYQSVVEYYSSLSEALIPNTYVCICTSVIELLIENRRDQALLATQLLMMVLPWQRRQQLQKVLKFLHLVVSDIFTSVDKKVTNYEAVARDFLSCIVNHVCVSRENCQILFDFLVFRVHQIFEFNRSLKEGVTFCQPMSNQEYSRSVVDYTKKSLRQLTYSVMDSTVIKLGEKKAWLKKLKGFHPHVHKECSRS